MSTGSKMVGSKIIKKECLTMIHIVRWIFSDAFYALQTLSTCNFEPIDLRKDNIQHLKALKEEKWLSIWKQG